MKLNGRDYLGLCFVEKLRNSNDYYYKCIGVDNESVLLSLESTNYVYSSSFHKGMSELQLIKNYNLGKIKIFPIERIDRVFVIYEDIKEFKDKIKLLNESDDENLSFQSVLDSLKDSYDLRYKEKQISNMMDFIKNYKYKKRL